MTQELDDAIAQIRAMTIDELRQQLETCQNKPVERASDTKVFQRVHWVDDCVIGGEK